MGTTLGTQIYVIYGKEMAPPHLRRSHLALSFWEEGSEPSPSTR